MQYLQNQRLVIAAYRLPFKIINTQTGNQLFQNSGGLVSAVLSMSQKMASNHKIAWVGCSDNIKNDLDQNLHHEKFELFPVQIEESIHKKFYGGFCNDTIWPLFHYFPSLTVFDEAYLDAYEKANYLFVNELEKVLKPDDVLWIHDYQLFLLPRLVRQKFPNITIGFFLHIPFPTFEIFRLMPRKWREEIVLGMLGADLVGFHTHDYCSHFLDSVSKVLDYENNLGVIKTPDRLVKTDAFPVGIDYHKFNRAIATPKVEHHVNLIKNAVKSGKTLFSVDRLDYTKGLIYRLKAFEYFLDNYPQWHKRVVLQMVVVPSRENIPTYQSRKRDIEATVGRINGKYGNIEWQPILYQYRSLEFDELIAFYHASDVALVTPLRDGMNLVCKEFVACQGEFSPGVLILSEMAGASMELNDALIINPTDVKEVGNAIAKALEMPISEKLFRVKRMQNILNNYDVFAWTQDFFAQLTAIKVHQKSMEIRVFNHNAETQLVKEYSQATNRLLLFDYDGTLMPLVKLPELATPTDELLRLLNTLCTEPANKVAIISGRDKQFLQSWFSDLPIYMFAEHGAWYKAPSKEWETNSEITDSWHTTVLPILEKYVLRCHGSFIEKKSVSLAWHYRNVASDFGTLRSKELKEELAMAITPDMQLQILDGHKVIEIKPMAYNKGTAAQTLLHEKYGFILAIGDDKTDEDLFAVLPEHAYSLKVGIMPSVAKYNLKSQKEVWRILELLLA